MAIHDVSKIKVGNLYIPSEDTFSRRNFGYGLIIEIRKEQDERVFVIRWSDGAQRIMNESTMVRRLNNNAGYIQSC